MHFVPQNNVYVYFRYNEEEKIMVALNKAGEPREINLAQYAELIKDSKMGYDVLTAENIALDKTLTIRAKQALVLKIN